MGRLLFRSGIYPLLDYDLCQRMSLRCEEVLQYWQRLGLSHYQLRAKSLSSDAYLDLARRCRQSAPALVMLANDYAALALDQPLLFGGVHLGQEDWQQLSADLRRRLLHPPCGFLSGLSCHNFRQLQEALAYERWSYLALGPCFSLSGKPGATTPLLGQPGLSAALSGLRAVRPPRRHPLPAIVFIGGIDAKRLSALLPEFKRGGFSPILAMIAAALPGGDLPLMRRMLAAYID
ncbi:MAG: thiamine phosphate synthase [Leptospirales bacterium]|nr:thiamine phosphate synthase [Leptospirales bacterium]